MPFDTEGRPPPYGSAGLRKPAFIAFQTQQ
jgi:hypothetical protein